MKRKVNKVGQNTLTVSLPNKWIKENKIEKGDELDVNVEADVISFSKSEREKGEKEVRINIDNYSYLSLARYIYLLYRTDYDKIILTYSKPEIYDPKKERSTDFSLG